jgi:ribosomal protein S18 acetylase RimI-like enzyme
MEAALATVSTAASNAPAIALYEKYGFRLRSRWMTHGIDMVTLARDAT